MTALRWDVDQSSEDRSTEPTPRRGRRRSGTSTRADAAGPSLHLAEPSTSEPGRDAGSSSRTARGSVAVPSSTRTPTADPDDASAVVVGDGCILATFPSRYKTQTRPAGWTWDGHACFNRRLARRLVVDDFGNELVIYRCPHCRRYLERTYENFSTTATRRGKGSMDDKVLRWDSICRSCRILRNDIYKARLTPEERRDRRHAVWGRIKADPVRYGHAKWASEQYRRKNAAKVAALQSAANKRRWERIKSDPAALAELNRKRRERGKQIRANERRLARLSLPGPPLGRLLIRLSGGDGSREVAAIARRAGVDESVINKWVRGDNVWAATADRVITRLGLEWWNVWPPPLNGHTHGRPAEVLRYIDDAKPYCTAAEYWGA